MGWVQHIHIQIQFGESNMPIILKVPPHILVLFSPHPDRAPLHYK